MAGIYLHIPFCKTRCIYCDFYSTTQSELKTRYVRALCSELKMRKEYLLNEPIDTLYFGGGTPSQLNETDLHQIFDALQNNYDLSHCTEITLEANPDDLSAEYVEMLSNLPFNRISMGIQTFNDSTLQLLKRRHNAQTAIEAVDRCRKAGFDNISIDLIYGLPGETKESWMNDLHQAIALHVEHISAYHLIYEENTPIYTMLKQHRVKEVDEDLSLTLFSLLIKELKSAGYEHYEISNFCRPGKYAKHNTAYWKGIPYLGCGPSAHSFDKVSREWNVSSLNDYMLGIENGHRMFEIENLDMFTQYNEFIITTMRTQWGTSLAELKEKFGTKMQEYCLQMSAPYLKNRKLEIQDESLRLTQEGIFVSDGIMSDLLWVD